jgi:hypothetical protein
MIVKRLLLALMLVVLAVVAVFAWIGWDNGSFRAALGVGLGASWAPVCCSLC